jgi:hypothetical protein
MGLFNINESKSLIYSKDNSISYFSEANIHEIRYEIYMQEVVKLIDAGIKADGDMSKLVKINGMFQHIDDLNWLERLQLKMENKIQEYNKKLKNDKTGTFSKVWTNIKKFLLKVVHSITSTINKLVSKAKILYKTNSSLRSGRTPENYIRIRKMNQIKDKNIRNKIASRIGSKYYKQIYNSKRLSREQRDSYLIDVD